MIWTPTRLENIIPKIRKTISKVLIRTKNQKFISKLFFSAKDEVKSKTFFCTHKSKFQNNNQSKNRASPKAVITKRPLSAQKHLLYPKFRKKRPWISGTRSSKYFYCQFAQINKNRQNFPSPFFWKKNRKKIREKTPHDNHLFQKNESSFFLKNFTKNMSYKNYFM